MERSPLRRLLIVMVYPEAHTRTKAPPFRYDRWRVFWIVKIGSEI